MDILKSIYIEATADGIQLIGNDNQIGIETNVKADVHQTGKCTVDARIFSDIIKKLPDEIIDISVDHNHKVTISCIDSKFNLIGKNPDEYPALPIVEKETAITIDKFLFNDMIRQTIFATSQDQSRPILTGSLLQLRDNTMTMVSIDLYRVAIRTIDIDNPQNFKLVIPARALNELMKITANDSNDDQLSIYATEQYIKFMIDDIIVIARLLEGEFINYEQIMPNDYKSLLTCSKASIYAAIDRASLISSYGKNTSLLFNIEDDNLQISSNVEVGNVSENVAINLEGPLLKIGFNPKYWLEALKVIDSDQIQVELTSNINPCIIRPVGQSNYTYLLLPVRILEQ